MPIYEFHCRQCQRKTSLWVKTYNPPASPICSACGSADTVRIFSPFAHHRSEADRLEEIDTSLARGEDYYRDSRNIGLWAKKRARELGVERETLKQLDEAVDRAKEDAHKIWEKTP